MSASHEAQCIKELEQSVKHLGVAHYKKQVKENRIILRDDGILPEVDNVYFQFGDYRIQCNKGTVVVEFDSSGGVTNLMKYWYCLEKGLINTPIYLFHFFYVASKNDYMAHRKMWQMFADKMKNNFTMFGAQQLTYGPLQELKFEDIVNKIHEFS